MTRQNLLFLSILRSTSLLTKIQKLHLLGSSSVRVLQTNQSSQVYRGGSTTAAASKMDCFVIIDPRPSLDTSLKIYVKQLNVLREGHKQIP